ncbi:MAG TPA: LysR family transcriptional regulator [Ureibacillus sp.]|nr:LysR family transcriptional regulator [Ureibacillus sp.]
MIFLDHQLEIFVTTAEQKSFTRAAELLHITPSAVSLSIKALEKKLDTKLFDRNNKYVQLTKSGQIVYTQAKEILLKYDHMRHLLSELEPSINISLSIGAAYTFGEYFLPSIIYAFNKRHSSIIPDITIHNSKTITDQVQKQELDIGFIVRSEIGDISDVDIFPFYEDNLVIVARPDHPILKSSGIDLDLLEAETWIIREVGSGTREVTEKFFSQLGISPKKIMSFGSSQTIKESVALGLGISYLSESIVKNEIQAGTLGAISLLEYQNKSSFHYIIHRSQTQSMAIKQFREFLDTYTMSEIASIALKKKIRKG